MLSPEYYSTEAGSDVVSGPFCLLELKQRYIDGRLEMESRVSGPCAGKILPPSIKPDSWEEVYQRDDIWHDLEEAEDEDPEEEEEEEEAPDEPVDPAAAQFRDEANKYWAHIKPLSLDLSALSPEGASKACKALTTALSIQSERPPLPTQWASQVAKTCVNRLVHQSIASMMVAKPAADQSPETQDFVREALRAIAMLAQPVLLQGTEEGAKLATPEMAAAVMTTALNHQGSLRIVVYALQAISGLGKSGKISNPENKANYKLLTQNPQYLSYMQKKRSGGQQPAPAAPAAAAGPAQMDPKALARMMAMNQGGGGAATPQGGWR